MADLIPSSKNYQDLLARLKSQIQTAQVRAAVSVNRELVLLYWGIGKEILCRQREEGWGAGVIQRLAQDLRTAFPDMKGLSRTNLLYMRAFAEAWPEQSIVQQVVGQIPWGHNIRLIDAVKTMKERLWYARAAIENGWSRNGRTARETFRGGFRHDGLPSAAGIQFRGLEADAYGAADAIRRRERG